MDKIVECVPNFSEGRDKTIINAISAAVESVEGIKLLDVDAGARMGALDICPFIPIKNVTEKDCIALSKKFGEKMAKELGVPVFLYAKSAIKPERVRLPDIRKGEYEALEEKFKDPSYTPDFGKAEFVPKSGATATGCRDILLAYNINLDTSDKSIANKISGKIRTSGVLKKDKDGNKLIGANGKPERIPGRFKGVQAGGMMYDENMAQVSMNLLNYRDVNLHDVFEAVQEEANKLGAKATGSEIVGLLPKESLVLAGKFYSKKDRIKVIDGEELISIAVEKLGLSELYPFKLEEKVIEYMVEETGTLASMKIEGFLSELASNSPAPGGGSVAALSGSLGAALSSMVCNLTIGKEKYSDVQGEIKKVLRESEKLRKDLTKLIDEDTEAFNDVMRAFKMPKETDKQKEIRSKAIQNGYKTAAKVPLETAKACEKILDVALVVANKGNKNSITDAAVSALMAQAGAISAILNVKINIGSIKDEAFVKKISSELEKLEKDTTDKTSRILNIVNRSL